MSYASAAMTTIDQKQGECFVFTFKEGLLSSVAHDLRMKVQRWSIAWDPEARTIDARFDASSLVVDTVMRDGHPAPGVLDAKDRDKIAKTTKDDVLDAGHHPEIRFRAQVPAGATAVRGDLTLHGKTSPATVALRQEGTAWVAEATLHQPDWGVKPYSAMFGTLKVKADVKVRVSVPAELVGKV